MNVDCVLLILLVAAAVAIGVARSSGWLPAGSVFDAQDDAPAESFDEMRARHEQRYKADAAQSQGPIGLKLLKETDPYFDTDTFSSALTELFLEVHRAISAGDIGPIREHLDDGAAESIRRSIDEVGAGRRRVWKGLQVERVTPVNVSRDEAADTVQVMITASAIRSVIETDTLQRVEIERFGDGVVRQHFQECWSLSRPAGTQTPEPDFTTCPNCGGPVTKKDGGACSYCHADLRRGPVLGWTILGIDFA